MCEKHQKQMQMVCGEPVCSECSAESFGPFKQNKCFKAPHPNEVAKFNEFLKAAHVQHENGEPMTWNG